MAPLGHRRALPGVALLASLLCGCELIAGYGDLKPWPPEAGAERQDAAQRDLDAGADAADTTDLDAEPGDLDADEPELDARGAAEASTGGPDARGPDTGGTDPDAGNPPDAGAPPDAGTPPDAAADAGICELPVGQDLCAALPYFNAQQVVDGRADEFCGIRAMAFDVVDCATSTPSTPQALPGKVEVRAAWSSAALHVHARVTDPTIIVQSDRARLWNGDAVEIYIAGASGSELTGAYNGTNDGGAIQLVLTPPSGPFGARGEAIFSRFGDHAEIAPSLYAGRIVPGGYEVELRYPWAPTAKPAVAGGRVAFTFAVDVQDDASAGGRQLQCLISAVFVDGSEACGLAEGTRAEPYCDDRTWCQPLLSP